MTTVYILLVVWSGGEIAKTHMVFESDAFCRKALDYEVSHPKGVVSHASCTPKQVKHGVPIEITNGLTFTPN